MLPPYTETLNQFLAIGAILIQVACVVLIAAMIFGKKKTNPIRLAFKKYAFIIGFVIAFAQVAFSLFYQNVIGFPVCELCWIGRIFIYPQLILFSLELYKKDRALVDFSIILAILDVITELYHVYIENGGTSGIGCASLTTTTQVSCATRWVYEFGYITIPMMAFSASFFILLVMVNYKYMSRK